MDSKINIKPLEVHPRKLPEIPPEEEVVISGIAGRFPESNNVEELYENLMNKKDLVTDDARRWKIDDPEIPQRTGKIHNIEKFDALFFGVHVKQAHAMDPMCRMLLEHSYEAIIDAGINPKAMRNTKTAVFIGCGLTESERALVYEDHKFHGFGITGCSRAMLANRLSYFFNLIGPSCTVDTACSSAFSAFELAYRTLRDGYCDAALVGGVNLCLHPLVTRQFFRLGALSAEGRCSTFDEAANGYARSEAISVVLLQRAKDAKRVYATVVHAKANCDGFKPEGITYPSTDVQRILLDEFYLECGVPPSEVSYIEAHGTGTKVGDPQEIRAIDPVFNKARTKDKPLLIGSVKTNTGHPEPASGLVSLTKVLLAMESGVIPPNINFENPREELKPYFEDRMKVILEATQWKGGYAGVNCFGFGGANCHVLVKSNEKEKVNNGAPQDDLPRLVAVSGRSDEAVDHLLKDLESRPVDVEYVRLFHDIHSDEISGHLTRGYTILPARGVAKTPVREIKTVSGAKRPVWFVFSGMGSQWAGMGEALLRIPTFAEAIRKCDAVLKPRNLDIFKILTTKDKSIFDNILHSFVGIAAVQIGLVDVLKSLGIEPDNVIGHSVGELGCAYADGCFTAEQMVLAAYSRGTAAVEGPVILGSMAAVGMGYKNLKDLCPPDIDVACHNSNESATISGPAESMKKFVAELQAKNIFAKEVPCSNIPFHSRYIGAIGKKVLLYLKKIIPNPKARSPKWLSTSVPMDKWNTPEARLCSAEYHTNNLLNSVLFEETSVLIPENAVAIEIAPHGLLQAILRRALPSTVENIALAQRDHKDNVEMFLRGLGKMFNVGLHPQLANLYPHVEYPVSRSTRKISPLIKWEHSDDWYVPSYKTFNKALSGERTVKIELAESEFEYLAGHVIDGRNLYPATGYLQLVWESLAMMNGVRYTELAVVFENVKFMRATYIPKDKELELTVMIQKGTGRFELIEGGAAVVTGHVRVTENPAAEKVKIKMNVSDEEEVMTMRDMYKEMRLRGYQYHGLFRSLQSATTDGSKGHVVWKNNWVAFLDNILQIKILGTKTRGSYVPTSIKKLTIDPAAHLKQLGPDENEKEFPVYCSKLHNILVCSGIEYRGLKFSAIVRKKPAGDPVLEEYKFVPFADRAEVSLGEITKLCTHVSLENHQIVKVRTVELIDDSDQVPSDELLSPRICECLGDLPLIQADVNIVSTKLKARADNWPANLQLTDSKKLTGDASALLAVGYRLLSTERAGNLDLLLKEVRKAGFLLSREKADDAKNVEQAALAKGLHVILEKKCKSDLFVLLRKQVKPRERSLVIDVNNDKFDWVDKMRQTMTEESAKDTADNTRIILIGQGEFDNGLMGLINCLKQEPGGEIVRGVLIQDPKAPKFSVDNPVYAKQLQKDLVVSVLRENGVWGSYRHLPLPELKPKPMTHVWLSQKVRGDLTSLTWFEGPIRPDDKNKDVVNVYYSAINFRDVMLATGKLAAEAVSSTQTNKESLLGFEYSGIDASGKRVMGLADTHCLANKIIADRHFAWEIPDKWSLEEAATVPVVYGTCLYGLYVKGKMKKGDSILIHAGTGGVGQAAINLALQEGCEVFTTVGTPEKRRFIRDTFPQIPDDHIGNSRDTSFEQMIMDKTNGRGVDIVLNSLSEEKLLASVACLAWGGRFLEIGKFDLSMDNPLGMECFLNEVSFQGVMLDRLMCSANEEKVFLTELMNDALRKGLIKPLVRTVFPKERAEDAFRYMAAGKHIGKVLVKIRNEKESLDVLSPAIPLYHCLPDRSYVILGGLGGFGLELADWLVMRGARHLVLTSRVGIRNGYQKSRLEAWKSFGANVIVIAGKEASNRKDCQDILETATKIAPVDGVFNLAVVLRDALWDNQTPKSFEESFRPKAWATKHLDVLTRKLCPALRHFVVFSSVSCGRGNAGQSNYGMSNSAMERICERRVSEGLPGLAVQWGAVGDVGLVADMQEDNKELVIGGTLPQRIASCLQELDGFLQQSRPIVSSMVVAEKKAGTEGTVNLVDTILNIMGLKDLKGVNLHTSFAELGMDSMMSVEIKQTLEREFEIYLTAQNIRNLNFAKLQELSQVDDKAPKEIASIRSEDSENGILIGLELFVRAAAHRIETCTRLKTMEESGRGESFIVPGIECLDQTFESLAPKLRSPTNCLQLDYADHRHKSISDIVDHYLPHLLERSKDSKFLMIGYSFGSLIAIELTRQLEKRGFTGKLIIIDGGSYLLQTYIGRRMKGRTESDIENYSLMEIMDVSCPAITSQFAVEVQKCSNWEDKLQLFKRLCPPEQTGMSEKLQRDICTSVYLRISAILRYDPSNSTPIKSPIVLLKPTTPIFQIDVEDHELSKITSNKIDVHYVSGNHVTMLDNDAVAKAINGDPL